MRSAWASPKLLGVPGLCRGSYRSWVAAVVVAPQLLLDRHWQERRAVWAIVAVFIVNVATLCLLLRFVVFLTDFFRRPRREHA